MGSFTDLHLHLIPGVDDGPANDDESIDLARQLVSDGVNRLAVTPHFNAWNPNLLKSMTEVEERLASLREVFAAADIPLDIHAGAEHFLTPELIQLVESRQAPTLASGPYILVELPFDSRPLYAEDLLYQLGLAGLMPVLAHPDRYAWVVSNPDALEKLVDGGIYLQLTAGSFGGQYGPRVKRTAEYILRKGWYSLVGSDLHHAGQPRSLATLAASIEEVAGPVVKQLLFQENPDRVFSGETLRPVPPVEEEEQAKKKLFGLFG